MTRIKAIFFDAAGTLLHAHPSVGHVYAEVLARCGPTVDSRLMEQTFRKMFSERRGERHTVSALENDGYDWWRALVFDALDSLEICLDDRDAFFRELYWRFADADVWRLFPDAMPALLEARGRGLKTALVSNWDVRLRRVIDAMGIRSLFDALVISAEVGVEKPDPDIFRIACERLGVPREEALHVGDSQREDIEGATAAGVHCRLLDRSARSKEDAIADLRELLSGSVFR